MNFVKMRAKNLICFCKMRSGGGMKTESLQCVVILRKGVEWGGLEWKI
jgi:hypothetical protein